MIATGKGMINDARTVPVTTWSTYQLWGRTISVHLKPLRTDPVLTEYVPQGYQAHSQLTTLTGK